MEAVAVDQSYAALIVFLGNNAAGIHAERPAFILEGIGIIDQLGLIELPGQMVHDGIGRFHPDADIHSVIDGFQAQLVGLPGQPLRAAPSGRCLLYTSRCV